MQRVFASLLLVMIAILPGFGCKSGGSAAQKLLEPVKLTYWSVFNDSDSMEGIITAYRALHPNVSIEYTKLRYDEYNDALLRAFAEDRGPDIFSVQNTGMKGALSLIAPMPSTVELAYQETRGTIKKELVTVVRKEPTLSLRSLNDTFIDVVPDDVVYPATEQGQVVNRIYGLPLSVDTLALYYNRDLLDAAGIPTPPSTWEEFQADVVKLTKYDAKGKVVQSGAAIGTGKNVERAGDILSALMMQSNVPMADTRGRATFSQKQPGSREVPAVEAWRFYTNFANPTKEVYTWDTSLGSSFDAFAAGQTAFFFGYSYHDALIKARSPKLRFSVAPLPQLDAAKPVNFAQYWVETVSKKTKHASFAWDFVQFAAKEANVKSYLQVAKKPTALRNLVLWQADDALLAPFASQLLRAKDWYNGKNPDAALRAVADMIDKVVSGTMPIEEAIVSAEAQVNQTL
jgi:multiple sugar transport system substrate-binding protein